MLIENLPVPLFKKNNHFFFLFVISSPRMGEFYPLFFENLSDSIPSVRQGAAISLGNVVKAYGKMKFYIIPFSQKRVNGYGCWVYLQFFQVQIPLK